MHAHKKSGALNSFKYHIIKLFGLEEILEINYRQALIYIF